MVVSQERTTTRLAYILDYSADAHRAVEFASQITYQFCIFEFLDIGTAAAKVALYKADDFLEVFMIVVAAVEQLKIFKSPLLVFNQYSSQYILIKYGVAFEAVGHYVVYILDEDYIGVNVVEVFDERTMSARTEKQ